VGDFSPFLKSGSLSPGASRAVAMPSGVFDMRGRDWLFWNFRCLDEKLPESAALIRDIITQADFSDLRRLGDIVLNFKNDAAASIAPDGHRYAAGRAESRFSKSRAVDELWDGISQLKFLKQITAMETAEIAKNLTRIRDKIAANGLFLNLTASKEAIDAALPLLAQTFSQHGAPKPRSVAPSGTVPDDVSPGDTSPVDVSPEVWSSPALQVGFASTVFPAAEYATREYAAGLVLAHYASTGELWETIRMKGGAYGAFAYLSGLDRIFTLASYRDPAPLKTLRAFQSSLKKIGRHGIDKESIEKALIGTYAKETRPQTPAQKGMSDCLRFLSGVEDSHRARIRRYMLNVTAEDVAAAAARLAAAAEEGRAVSCVLEGAAGVHHNADKTAATLGCGVQALDL
jgi:Zn-dependent M16 (insulinase) family peptidase